LPKKWQVKGKGNHERIWSNGLDPKKKRGGNGLTIEEKGIRLRGGENEGLLPGGGEGRQGGKGKIFHRGFLPFKKGKKGPRGEILNVWGSQKIPRGNQQQPTWRRKKRSILPRGGGGGQPAEWLKRSAAKKRKGSILSTRWKKEQYSFSN